MFGGQATQLPMKPNPKHLVVLSGASASSTMDHWHRELEQAMEAQRVEEDEDFKEFEESFFDEWVTSA